MEQVLDYRLNAGDVQRAAECIDYVALLDRSISARQVWLRHPTGEVVGPLLVIDCARRKDAPALRNGGGWSTFRITLGFHQLEDAGPARQGSRCCGRRHPSPSPASRTGSYGPSTDDEERRSARSG